MADSASLVAFGAARSSARPIAWPLFLGLVGLASLLPFAAVPFAQHVIPNTEASLSLLVVLAFVGNNFHVAASAWFYTDGEMRPHLRSHPRRYLVVPAALIAGGAVLFHLLPAPAHGWLLAAFFCWQLWHYQKQNVGLLSFVAAGTGRVPVSPWERRTLMLAALPGILGFFSLSPIGLPYLQGEFVWLHQLGMAAYLPVSVVLGVALVKVPALRTNALRLGCLLFGVLFFVPTFLFSDQLSATLSYAMAHGLQYVVFMGFVAGRRPQPIASLAMLAGLATLGALALNAGVVAPDRPDFAWGSALYGAFVGAVCAHFVLDAGIWRLREPFQRAYMRRRFAFIFDR